MGAWATDEALASALIQSTEQSPKITRKLNFIARSGNKQVPRQEESYRGRNKLRCVYLEI